MRKTDDFIETSQGQEWHRVATEQLLGGDETHPALRTMRELQYDAITKIMSHPDWEEIARSYLGAMLDEYVTGGALGRLYDCEDELIEHCFEVGHEITAPYADEHYKAMMEYDYE